MRGHRLRAQGEGRSRQGRSVPLVVQEIGQRLDVAGWPLDRQPGGSARRPDLAVQQLDFQRGEEAFRDGVIETIADAPGRGQEAGVA